MENKDLISALNWRYAVKKFDSSKKIDTDTWNTLLDSLRLTPSSFGLQFWKFVSVEDQTLKETLVSKSFNQSQVADASNLVVLCSLKSPNESDVNKYLSSMATDRGIDVSTLDGFKKVVMDFMGRKSDEQIRVWADNQLYIALGNLLTCAAVLGVDACPMEGFSKKGYSEVLGLEELGLEPVVVCPLGYRHSEDNYATLKKSRFDLSDLIITK